MVGRGQAVSGARHEVKSCLNDVLWSRAKDAMLRVQGVDCDAVAPGNVRAVDCTGDGKCVCVCVVRDVRRRRRWDGGVDVAGIDYESWAMSLSKSAQRTYPIHIRTRLYISHGLACAAAFALLHQFWRRAELADSIHTAEEGIQTLIQHFATCKLFSLALGSGTAYFNIKALFHFVPRRRYIRMKSSLVTQYSTPRPVQTP